MGFLVLERMTGESLTIGNIRVTVAGIDYLYGRLSKENGVTLHIDGKRIVLRRQEKHSISENVHLVLADVNASHARFAIQAPKHIPILRDDAHHIPNPMQLAESHLERQKRVNY